MRPIIKCLLFVVFCYPSLYGQYYFPPAHGTWQQKDPGEYSIDSGKIAEAIDFAKKNEYWHQTIGLSYRGSLWFL